MSVAKSLKLRVGTGTVEKILELGTLNRNPRQKNGTFPQYCSSRMSLELCVRGLCLLRASVRRCGVVIYRLECRYIY